MQTQTEPLQTEPHSAPVSSPTRRHLLAMAGATCGAAVVGTLLARPARADIVKRVGKILYLDPIVVNFALELEELEADFFARLPRTRGYNALQGQEAEVLSTIARQDMMHFEAVKALRQSLGYTSRGGFDQPNALSLRPARNFRYPSLKSREEILNAALDIKETALFAYHGAIELVGTEPVLKAAAAIAGVEGRHATVLRELLGQNPVPAPYEGARGAQASGNKLSRYGFSGGTRK